MSLTVTIKGIFKVLDAKNAIRAKNPTTYYDVADADINSRIEQLSSILEEKWQAITLAPAVANKVLRDAFGQLLLTVWREVNDAVLSGNRYSHLESIDDAHKACINDIMDDTMLSTRRQDPESSLLVDSLINVVSMADTWPKCSQELKDLVAARLRVAVANSKEGDDNPLMQRVLALVADADAAAYATAYAAAYAAAASSAASSAAGASAGAAAASAAAPAAAKRARREDCLVPDDASASAHIASMVLHLMAIFRIVVSLKMDATNVWMSSRKIRDALQDAAASTGKPNRNARDWFDTCHNKWMIFHKAAKISDRVSDIHWSFNIEQIKSLINELIDSAPHWEEKIASCVKVMEPLVEKHVELKPSYPEGYTVIMATPRDAKSLVRKISAESVDVKLVQLSQSSAEHYDDSMTR